MPGFEDEWLLIPVVVVDVGAVEAFDHFGGAGTGFDGLEDAEGDEGAAVCIVQAVRINDEGDVREGLGEVEGVYADLPDVVPPADVEGGGGCLPGGASVDVRKLEGDVADTGTPVGDAERAGARGDLLAIPLPTCVMHARICVFAASRTPCRVAISSPASCWISAALPAPACVTCAAFMSSPSLSSDCG